MRTTSLRNPQPLPTNAPARSVGASGPRWTRWLVVVAALAAVMAMSACGDDDDDDTTSDAGTSPAPTAADLDGKTFVATELQGREIVTGTEVTLAFEGGQLSASAGCNTMSGTYTISGSTLDVSDPLAATRMFCEDPLQSQDDWLAGFLVASPTIGYADDVLTLTADGVTLTATAQT